MIESFCASVFLSEMNSDHKQCLLLPRILVWGKMRSNKDSAQKSFHVVRERIMGMQTVPHWVFLDRIYWGSLSRQEPQQVWGPLWSTAQLGLTKGSGRVRYKTPGENPGPLSCGTFKLHVLRSACLSPDMALASSPVLPPVHHGLGGTSPFLVWSGAEVLPRSSSCMSQCTLGFQSACTSSVLYLNCLKYLAVASCYGALCQRLAPLGSQPAADQAQVH